MHWIKPAISADSHAALEKKLWDAANMLWAGADLKPSVGQKGSRVSANQL